MGLCVSSEQSHDDDYDAPPRASRRRAPLPVREEPDRNLYKAPPPPAWRDPRETSLHVPIITPQPGARRPRAAGGSARIISSKELRMHSASCASGSWLAINGVVFDVTAFADRHPGGAAIIRSYLATDATSAFKSAHGYLRPEQHMPIVGILKD